LTHVDNCSALLVNHFSEGFHSAMILLSELILAPVSCHLTNYQRSESSQNEERLFCFIAGSFQQHFVFSRFGCN